MLLVPKRRVGRVLDLAAPLLGALVEAGEAAAARLELGPGEYTLCANGGPRQEVQQVHFHLFGGETYMDSRWEIELHVGSVADAAATPARLRAAVREQELDRRGYTLVIHRGEFYLIAGARC